MHHTPEMDKLAPAIVAVQRAIRPAIKDGNNPHFRSHYATLNAVWDAARGPLSENGLAVVQFVTSADPGRVGLTTMLIHSSGQYVCGTGLYPLPKDDPQGAGSAITYGRRYGMCAILGIVADEDDDGNAASNVPREQGNKKPAAPTARIDTKQPTDELDLPF